ncbi:unnamed protein product [Penicillium salamii]|uniref:Uncharacterized protein n=1 Tax=Penicillium salamii TaxID=1612424 RepID=A0A9W4N9X2_9EURO|nr:unnamed protein product [Penicillium salamii]CAG8093163.1 unnamed protein product [Penicillium salamii]CAG8251815.1 unnamed protein product [Penicillium salamii]CAG8252535.1 unnamed protein product [Penicillium salamii]CAG8304206.1 unnamed protein product [Penicillium salamii]
MSVTKASVVEEAGVSSMPAKKSFGARVAAHFKKWWWAHLIAFIIALLVIILPVVYVGYPKIAQDAVNDSTLDIKQMVISDPTPETFHLNQTQILGSKSSYHPQIYEFDAEVSLGGADAPFAMVTVPGVKSNDGAEIHVDQHVDLSDSDAFGDFATAVMMNKEVSLNIYGRPGLKEGSLPKTTVTYNKTVSMKGLNQLEGFAVSEFHIMIPSVNGYNMNGTVFIPNPSVMTITMVFLLFPTNVFKILTNQGNLSLSLAVDGKSMGTTYLNDLVLKPGDNNVPMLAKVDQAAVIGLLTSSDNPYKDGIVPFDISGKSSSYNGKELPYFTKALSANKLTVKLDVGAALKEIGLNLIKSALGA